MKNILEEAMEDSKLLKETAIENAKNVLIEAISPKIKAMVEQQLGETDVALEMGGMYEMGDDQNQDEEHEDMKMKEMASAMDEAGMYEMEEADMAMEAADADEEPMAEAKDEEEEDTVEMTKEDFNAALAEVLSSMKNELAEATVSKGFKPNDANGVSNGDVGLMDTKSGEHQWKDETPPDAEDWTVKENKQLKRTVQKLVAERNEAVSAFRKLHKQLKEVNLFNSKLIYTNKLLQTANLSERQRRSVIETFDRAESIREVELVYNSLSESLKIAGALNESKNVSKGKSSRVAPRSSTLLNEGAQRGSSEDDFATRMKQLSGIVE